MRKSLLLLAALAASPAVSAQSALSAGATLGTPITTPSTRGNIAITQNASTTIEVGGVACALNVAPRFTTENSYLRVFDLADEGLSGPITITSADIGAVFGTGDTATDLNVPTDVILYRMAPGTDYSESFGRETLTEVARATFTVDTGGGNGLFNVAFTGSPVFQNTDLMVIEWSVPDGTDPELNGQFNIRYGSNDDGQEGVTYLATETSCTADGTGLPPADVATLGDFGHLHWVVVVNADGATANEGPASTRRISLGSAVPNPAVGSTVIPFEVREASDVRLSVYDALGREVAVLVEGALAAGNHSATFVADGLPAGAYVYRLVADGDVLTNRLTVTR